MSNKKSKFYDLYMSLPEEYGVYAFYNNLENKYYVGFCLTYKGGMRWRCRDHLYALKSNKHATKKLQDSWNINSSCWTLIVLEITTNILQELYWMDKLDSINNGYNTKRKEINNNSGENNPMYGKHHTSKSKELIRIMLTKPVLPKAPPKPVWNKLNDISISEITKLKNEGYTVKDLAKYFNCSQNCIYNKIKP